MGYVKKLFGVLNANGTNHRPFVSMPNRIWYSQWTADISLLLVALIWGTTYVASKDVVSSVPVMQFLFIRFLLTTILMLPVTFRAILQADRPTWLTGVVFGGFLFAAFVLETYGVASTSAANAGFIISLFAVMVPLIHSIVYRKRPRFTLLGAIIVSVLGTALLTLHGYHMNVGDFLVLGAAFCHAVGMTFTKRMTDDKQMNSGGANYNSITCCRRWVWLCDNVPAPILLAFNALILADYGIFSDIRYDVCLFCPTDDDTQDFAFSGSSTYEQRADFCGVHFCYISW
jgi:drug/metabolite transporter (DMT)-like permease